MESEPNTTPKPPRFRYKNHIILALCLLLIVSAVGIWKIYWHKTPHLKYPPGKEHAFRNSQILVTHHDMVAGLDISQHQGKINWQRVKQIENNQIRFVFMRATLGQSSLDPKFIHNWQAAKNQNLIRGAYHLYLPQKDPAKQASNFIKNVSLQKGDLPPVLDIEKLPKDSEKLKADLHIWLDLVYEHYKVKPIIYSGETYYKKYLEDEFKDYPFWIANYNNDIDEIKDEWLFWQFTEKASITGIKEKTDVNIFHGTLDDLRELTLMN